jgi:uncharacterized protein
VKNILDAGPLVAWLNETDRYHSWALEVMTKIGPPFYTCSEALAEAAALTGKAIIIVEMVQAGDVLVDMELNEEAEGVLRLLRKYKDREMDLADACIVRMTELTRNCRVITVDRNDFAVYRRNGREVIPTIVPPG